MSDHICPWWLAYSFDNWFRRLLHNPEKLYGPYVKPGMTVLDAGCGMGFNAIALAKMIGDKGCVIAADIQVEMLNVLQKRAAKAGVLKRICMNLSRKAEIGLEQEIDFALAFWMAHETADPLAFFCEISDFLKPNGRVMIVEPYFHVSAEKFQHILDQAQKAGFKPAAFPSVRFSRACVLAPE